MICQHCGIEAPTKSVTFYQNIGVLVMRLSRTVEGNLCKSCIHSTFWECTLITLVVGWWGIISFVVTPIFLLNNLFRYLFCLGMDPVPPNAQRPELTDEVLARLQPWTNELMDQLNRGDEFERVVENIAMRANATDGQVALYVQALIAASRNAN